MRDFGIFVNGNDELNREIKQRMLNFMPIKYFIFIRKISKMEKKLFLNLFKSKLIKNEEYNRTFIISSIKRHYKQ